MCKFILLKFCFFNDWEMLVSLSWSKVRIIFGLNKPLRVFIFRVVSFNCLSLTKVLNVFELNKFILLVATLLGCRIMLHC